MLSIAGQTAGPIRLKFFVTGGCYRLKEIKICSRATLGPSASFVYICQNEKDCH